MTTAVLVDEHHPGGVVAEGVRRRFGPVEAVRGIDLTDRPGEVTALVGPGGVGQTTLLLVLATLLVPDDFGLPDWCTPCRADSTRSSGWPGPWCTSPRCCCGGWSGRGGWAPTWRRPTRCC